jgi:hypothetical protein
MQKTSFDSNLSSELFRDYCYSLNKHNVLLVLLCLIMGFKILNKVGQCLYLILNFFKKTVYMVC